MSAFLLRKPFVSFDSAQNYDVFFRLRGCSLAYKFWGKLAAKCSKRNRIYRDKFNFWGKLHDFKNIFLGEVAFIRLQLYNKKTPDLFTTRIQDFVKF